MHEALIPNLKLCHFATRFSHVYFSYISHASVIDSLSSDDSVNRLVTYLVEPAQEGDNDLRTFK